jgi:hypothetical protein
MLAQTGRRPALAGGIIDLIVRFFGSKAGVLGWHAEERGAVRIAVVLKVLERGIQGRMVIEDVIQLVQHGGRGLAMLALPRRGRVAATQRTGACDRDPWWFNGWNQGG